MVEVKNFFQEVDSHPEVRNFKLWKTEFSTFWIIKSEPKVQDDMHYHENDDHIFMVLEGEGLVRTPHKEYTMKQFDIVVIRRDSRTSSATPVRGDCCCSALETRVPAANRGPGCRG